MINGTVEAVVSRLSYFLLPLAFIALLPVGLIVDAPWLGIAAGAIAVPALDAAIGRREPPTTGPSRWEVRIIVLVFFAVLPWSLGRVAGLTGWLAVILAGASSGYVLGTIGLPAAHELGHRRPWFDRLLGQALLACIGYGHYQVAHGRHHVRACLPDDPATARREESLWGFFPRYFVGIWHEATESAARQRGWRRHGAVILAAASVLAVCLIAILYGPKGLVFWLVQATIGLFLIGSVDYIQHWGLRRRIRADGRPERQGPAHTWESPSWLSEHMTGNLTRHCFHHLAPYKEAAAVGRVPGAPEMPLSYGMMVIIAAIPPIFRRLMEPRLALIEHENR